MKKTALLLAITALALFSAVASTSSRAPKEVMDRFIAEKKTVARNLKEAEAKLAEVTKELASKLPKSEAKAFAKAQATWSAWRDAEAEYAMYRYASTGSSPETLELQFETMVIGQKWQLTDERIKRLESDLATPHHDRK